MIQTMKTLTQATSYSSSPAPSYISLHDVQWSLERIFRNRLRLASDIALKVRQGPPTAREA
jgi:hypothetical protein